MNIDNKPLRTAGIAAAALGIGIWMSMAGPASASTGASMVTPATGGSASHPPPVSARVPTGAVAAPAFGEDAIVKLVSSENRKCLQPFKGLADGEEPIVQETCNGSVAQQWTVHNTSLTQVHLINRVTKLCMEANGPAANGTRIDQWPCNWISNENWSFGIGNNLLVSLVGKTASHCIATPGSQDGLEMQLRFCDGNISQLWDRLPG